MGPVTGGWIHTNLGIGLLTLRGQIGADILIIERRGRHTSSVSVS